MTDKNKSPQPLNPPPKPPTPKPPTPPKNDEKRKLSPITLRYIPRRI